MGIQIGSTKNKGRGVFATKNFKKNDVIEICPVILVPEKEDKYLQKTILGRYVYEWNNKFSAIILGFGSIYNHSFKPNAFYVRDFKKKCLIYKALTIIKKGQEITVNYNGVPDSNNPVDDFIPIKE